MAWRDRNAALPSWVKNKVQLAVRHSPNVVSTTRSLLLPSVVAKYFQHCSSTLVYTAHWLVATSSTPACNGSSDNNGSTLGNEPRADP